MLAMLATGRSIGPKMRGGQPREPRAPLAGGAEGRGGASCRRRLRLGVRPARRTRPEIIYYFDVYTKEPFD